MMALLVLFFIFSFILYLIMEHSEELGYALVIVFGLPLIIIGLFIMGMEALFARRSTNKKS